MGVRIEGAKFAIKGGFLNRSLYIAAGTAAGTEFASTGAYARIMVALGAWTRGANGVAQNTNAQDFPTPTALLADPTHALIYSEASAGNLLWDEALIGDPNPPGSGAFFGFDAGAITFTLVGGNVTQAGSKAAFESGLVSGTRYLTLHSGDPGTTGADAHASAVLVAESLWTPISGEENKARNNAVVDFGIQSSDLPDLMWVALRDGAAANANVLWKDAFDNDPADPQLGATISFPINSITLGFNAA